MKIGHSVETERREENEQRRSASPQGTGARCYLQNWPQTLCCFRLQNWREVLAQQEAAEASGDPAGAAGTGAAPSRASPATVAPEQPQQQPQQRPAPPAEQQEFAKAAVAAQGPRSAADDGPELAKKRKPKRQGAAPSAKAATLSTPLNARVEFAKKSNIQVGMYSLVVRIACLTSTCLQLVRGALKYICLAGFAMVRPSALRARFVRTEQTHGHTESCTMNGRQNVAWCNAGEGTQPDSCEASAVRVGCVGCCGCGALRFSVSC